MNPALTKIRNIDKWKGSLTQKTHMKLEIQLKGKIRYLLSTD